MSPRSASIFLSGVLSGLSLLAAVPASAEHTLAQRRSPSHPQSLTSELIQKDRGGLDVRVLKGRVVLRGYVRTDKGWRMGKRTLSLAGVDIKDADAARESFRTVRRRILHEEHFPFSEEALITAAMMGASKAAAAAEAGEAPPSLAAIYTAATDAMVAELQKVDRWSRVETQQQHVERTTPAVNNVTAHRFPGDVLVVKVRRFRGVVSMQVRDAIAEAKAAGPLRGIVIDLRDNGGGSVHEAHQLLSTFFPEGKALLTTEYGLLGKPTSEEVMTADEVPGGADTQTPIALLVNGHSASASELTTGVMKDLGRATIVGEKTYGKGVGQSAMELPDGRVYQLTGWRRRLATLGTYHGKGIDPDLSAADAEALVKDAAQAGQIRARGDLTLRGALLHLWGKSPQEAP